jgi:hypothetical protein
MCAAVRDSERGTWCEFTCATTGSSCGVAHQLLCLYKLECVSGSVQSDEFCCDIQDSDLQSLKMG